MNLRVLVESDLGDTLEGDWGLPVELIDPDGVVYKKSQNNPTEDLSGQILYDTVTRDPEDGAEVIVHKPVVTLRLSSLVRVPKDDEKWIVKIPIIPNPTAPKVAFSLERPSEEGAAIGFIRLYLMTTQQEA
jgi:hypothetical protein